MEQSFASWLYGNSTHRNKMAALRSLSLNAWTVNRHPSPPPHRYIVTPNDSLYPVFIGSRVQVINFLAATGNTFEKLLGLFPNVNASEGV